MCLYLIKEIPNPNTVRYSILIRRLTSIDACFLLNFCTVSFLGRKILNQSLKTDGNHLERESLCL